jgi:hypothetical protein
MQNIEILTLSVLATVAITAERFVTAAGAPAAAGGNAIGASKSDAAVGELFPTIAVGTAIVVAGGAVAANAYVEVGADGKAVTQDTGPAVGVALSAATADGDRIEVLIIPNAPAPAAGT